MTKTKRIVAKARLKVSNALVWGCEKINYYPPICRKFVTKQIIEVMNDLDLF